jgi:putative chitinase
VGEEFMRAREFIVEDNESRTEEFHGVHMKLRDDGYEVVASALDDWGREMGSVVFNKGDGNELDPQDLLVIDKYRGQGIAKVMYDYKSYDVTKIADQGKESGEYFWQKNRGEERIWESADDETKELVTNAILDFYQNVGDIEKQPVDNYVSTAKEILGQVDDPTLKSKLLDIFRQAKQNPYVQGGVVTTIGALLAGGVLSSAQKMGLSPSQTNLVLQAILNTVIPTVVSRINGKSWSDTIKYTLASAGIGTGIAGMMEEDALDEDWKSALATGAMAGAMAMGANAKAPEMVYQTVEPGDTVYSIARQNNVNPLEIFKLNKMDRNTKLEIGQKVLVPDYSKPVKYAQPIAQPTTSFKDKLTSMIPKFSRDKEEEEGVTLLSDNGDAEAVLQTAAKNAGLKGAELAQFMAQTRHESWDFGQMKEVGNKKRFAKYETPRKAKQLGNKIKGDGERFKGRGFIQLTGRDNYTRASQQIFGDDRLVKNPDLASRPDIGAQIALWFWENRVRPNVNNFNNTKEVTNAINPGLSGLQDRHNKFKEYLAVL